MEYNNKNGDSYFFKNYFISNGNGIDQVIDCNASDQWDNGLVGNYWSDWTSPDNNHDRTVDFERPINIQLGIWDRYPLISSEWNDTDSDGFLDITENAYGTNITDPKSHPLDDDGDLLPDDRDYTAQNEGSNILVIIFIMSLLFVIIIIIIGILSIIKFRKKD